MLEAQFVPSGGSEVWADVLRVLPGTALSLISTSSFTGTSEFYLRALNSSAGADAFVRLGVASVAGTADNDAAAARANLVAARTTMNADPDDWLPPLDSGDFLV